MKVLLIKDLPKVGKIGEVIEVSDGYGRNFLIGKGYATKADEGEVRHFRNLKESEEKRKEQQKKKNEVMISELQKNCYEIKVKAGENGKPFGAVTANDVALCIKNKCGIEFDKNDFDEKINIKEIGTYRIKIKFSQGVRGEIALKILPLS